MGITLALFLFVLVFAVFFFSVRLSVRLSAPNGVPKEIEKCLGCLEESLAMMGVSSQKFTIDFGRWKKFLLKCLFAFGRWISRSWYRAREIVNIPLSSLTILNIFALTFYALVAVFLLTVLFSIAFLIVLAIANGWSFNF